MATEAIQTAITPEAVTAAQVEYDEQERAVFVTGRERTLLNFQTTGLLASELLPREWEEVSAYLLALVGRDPVKSGPSFAAHRVILGSIAGELRNYARQTGEPVGPDADLRAATSKAEERRIQARIDDANLAEQRRLDDIALQQAAQHTPPSPDPNDPEEAPTDHREPTKPVDDAWLL